jgi:hypothetical protein
MFASTVLSSCQSVLSTEAMLTVLGSSEAQRAMNYIGKDILGQLGGLLVMTGLSKTVDSNPQRVIKLAHVLQQTSMGMLLLSPLCPSYFLPIAGLANVCSNLSFMSFGGINAKCIQSVSTDHNVGELYTKLAINQTLASTLGLTLGMGLTWGVDLPAEVLFSVLGIGRVVSYQKAVYKILV